VEGIAALIMWVLANAVYVDMRRRGERGFKRLCAFWLGWPGTLVGMFSVDEASQPAIRHDDEGLRSLVEDIRRDRIARGDLGSEIDGPESIPPDDDGSDAVASLPPEPKREE
jgi:hypothetical protein